MRVLSLPICIGILWAVIGFFPANWAVKLFVPAHISEHISGRGTLWNGHIYHKDMQILARYDVTLAQYFKGEPAVEFRVSAPGLNMHGKAALKPGSISVFDVSAQADIAALPITDARLRGSLGQVDIDISYLHMGENCKDANGMMSTDILKRNRANWRWQGPELSGPIHCENGTFVAVLSGQDDAQFLDSTIRIEPTGIYQARFIVETTQPGAGAVLTFLGFEDQDGLYALTETGHLIRP